MGFHLKLFPSGTATYYARDPRTGRDYKIGRHGPMTAEQARARAKHVLGMLASGQDPKPPRSAPKAQKAAESRPITFGQLCSMWLAEHQKRNVLRSHRKAVDRWFSAYIVPELGDIPAADLDADAVRQFHGRYSRIPHTANCMLRMISSVWSFGEPKHVPVNANPCWTLINGQKKWCVQFYPEDERDRVLSSEELERIAQVIIEFQAEGRISSAEADLLRVKLLTGARSSELYRLKWSHVHLQDGHSYFELLQHKTKKKSRMPRYVPLSNAAAFLIKRQQQKSDYVFYNEWSPQSLKKNGPINIRRLELIWAGQKWEKFYAPTGKTYRGYSPGICDRAKIKGAWLHDIRRTVASIGGGVANINAHVLHKVLGWTDSETAGRYIRPPLDDQIEAANAIAAHVAPGLKLDLTGLAPNPDALAYQDAVTAAVASRESVLESARQRLNVTLAALGIGVTRLARLAGVEHSRVSEFRSGAPISAEVFAAIVAALDRLAPVDPKPDEVELLQQQLADAMAEIERLKGGAEQRQMRTPAAKSTPTWFHLTPGIELLFPCTYVNGALRPKPNSPSHIPRQQ